MSERGRTLRELREVAGLTERQLARKLVMTAARVVAWERGTLGPSRLQEGRLAGTLGVRVGLVCAAVVASEG